MWVCFGDARRISEEMLENKERVNGENVDADLILHILKYWRKVLAGGHKNDSGLKQDSACRFVSWRQNISTACFFFLSHI